MKRIEDIEKMSIEELEAASLAGEVPSGLEGRIKAALAVSSEMEGMRAERRRLPVRYTALALAAALAAILLIPWKPAPKDTFDDPLLAYAQVEQTFRFISDKMSDGVGLVREAESSAVVPGSIIKKINEK